MSLSTYLIVLSGVFLGAIIIAFGPIYKTMQKDFQETLNFDISVEEMKKIEEEVAVFLKKNNMRPGEDIFKIADVLNVKKGQIKEGLDGRARLSERDEKGNMYVDFQKGSTELEMRFDFAHECGHIINGDSVPVFRPEGKDKPQVDQLADYTAAALLMPLNEVYTDLQNSKYWESSKRVRVSKIRELCKKYDVSEVIALRRIREIELLKS